MPDEKKLYLVKSRVDHDKRYEDGDFIHLTEAEAEGLLNVNVVALHETDDAPETDDVPLTTLTVPKLKELAATLNVNLPSNASKDAIIAAIAEARAAQK